MTSLLWRHVYIERSQLVQYFTHSFTTCQVLNAIAPTSKRKGVRNAVLKVSVLERKQETHQEMR